MSLSTGRPRSASKAWLGNGPPPSNSQAHRSIELRLYLLPDGTKVYHTPKEPVETLMLLPTE